MTIIGIFFGREGLVAIGLSSLTFILIIISYI